MSEDDEQGQGVVQGLGGIDCGNHVLRIEEGFSTYARGDGRFGAVTGADDVIWQSPCRRRGNGDLPERKGTAT
jgi:hypothetical protein